MCFLLLPSTGSASVDKWGLLKTPSKNKTKQNSETYGKYYKMQVK